jgi:hypothetical protein
MKKISLLVVVGLVSLYGSAQGHEATNTLNAKHDHNHDHDHDHDKKNHDHEHSHDHEHEHGHEHGNT